MMKRCKRMLWTLSVPIVLLFVFFLYCTLTTNGLNTLIHLSILYSGQPITAVGIEGRLQDQIRINQLTYQTEHTRIQMNHARVTWSLRSLLDHQLHLEQLQADTVRIRLNNQTFIIKDLQLNALIDKNKIHITLLNSNYSDLPVQGTLALNTHSPFGLTSTLSVKDNPFMTGMLHVAGDINLVQWTGTFRGLADLSLKGSLAHLTQLDQLITWQHLLWPGQTPQKQLSKKGEIHISGTLPHLKGSFSSEINRSAQEEWQLNGDAQGLLPWSWTFTLTAQPLQHQQKLQEEGFYSDVSLTGDLKNPDRGEFHLKVAPGRYRVQPEGELSYLTIQGGSVHAYLTKEGLKGQGVLTLDAQKKLDLNFLLPGFNLIHQLTMQQPFTAKLSLVMSSLDFVSALFPEINNPQGHLAFWLTAQGTLSKPTVKTKTELTQASADIPSLGLHLNNIQCSLAGAADHWEGTGTLRAEDHELTVKGKGSLSPTMSANLTLEGTNFPIIHTKEYQLSASPKLQINYDHQLWHLLGSVLVPSAQITFQSFTNSVSLSHDVVFERQHEPYAFPIHSQTDVQITAGDNVALNAQGLHAKLAGSVTIKQTPQSAMSATGEFNVVSGEYKAYGQNLSIEHGELFFTGGSIDNPGINLRAAKTINSSSSGASDSSLFNNSEAPNIALQGNMTVGVKVTGRLTDPEIQLFSQPALLSQADILSMLVLGRPANQANKAGGQLLLAAISSMNLGGKAQGAQLLSQLKQSLGLDFNVETNSNYNLLTNTVSDKTAFVVSKSLSERIIIGYNVGLSQADPNMLTLKYLLNKFFSVQINSSTTSSSIDVLYTSSKK